jgi:hypothetical protein
LKAAGMELYLSNKQNLTGVVLTEKIEQAEQFAVGFDSQELKLSI